MLTPRDLEKMMKNVKMEQIEAEEVVIKTCDKTLLIKNPQVVKTNMMGKTTFQVTGEVEEKNSDAGDIEIIVQKTGASKEEAEQALNEELDMAAAILKLESRKI